jgi:hypothetical protein
VSHVHVRLCSLKLSSEDLRCISVHRRSKRPPRSCVAVSKAYTSQQRLHALMSAVFRNCDEILQRKFTKNPNKNSIYPIDPDQAGPLDIFGAFCDFLPDTEIGVTYVSTRTLQFKVRRG